MKKNRAFIVIAPAVSIIALAIILLSFTIFNKVNKSITDIANHKILVTLNDASNEIADIVQNAETLQQDIVQDNLVKKLLQDPNSQEQKNKALREITRLISESKISQNNLTSIALFSKDQKILLLVDSNSKDITKNQTPLHDYTNTSATQHPPRLSLFLNPNGNIICLSLPIYNIDKTFMGSIEIHINMQSISDILDKYAVQISPNAILAVSNSKGTVLSISNHSQNLMSTATNLSAFEHLLRSNLPNNEKIITSTYLHNIGIYVGLYQSANILDKVSDYVRHEIVALIGITIILSCITIYFLLRLTLNRQSDEGKRLHQAVDLIQMPMWEYIAPGILHLNKYALILLGKKPNSPGADLEGIKKLIHPDDLQEGLFILPNSNNELDQVTFDKTLRFMHEDGYWHWLQLKGHVKHNKDGSVQSATGVFIDVHEWHLKMEQDKVYQLSLEKVVQEQYEKAQKHDNQILYEKSLLYNVINCIPDWIYFKDTSGRFLGGNQSFLDLLNLDVAIIRGKKTTEIPIPFTLCKEDFGFLADDMIVIEKGEMVRKTITLCYADGHSIPCEVLKVAFKDHLGNAVGVVTIARDISEHIAIEDALRHAKEAATAANTAKSDFLANMSHEIRTPLNGIIGLNHLAQQRDPSDELRGYLEKIDLSAKTLLKIVNDILDFSKIEAGRIDLEHIPFRIKRSIQFAIDMLQVQANERNIYLNLDVQGELPEYILGDPLRFRQTMLNLLNNAVKFTSEGGVTLSIIVSQEITSKAEILIKIQDTGIGMTKNQVSRIFQPFMQADSSTTRRYGGTGLGLPITRSLIEAMGSKLIVESEENVGSTFSFTLHAEIPSTVESDKTPEEKNQENLDRIKGKNILLVEDNEINQLIATEVLENLGLNVSVACDGQQGVDMAMHGDFDLVLMDIQMPVMDGLTAAKTLRFNKFDKPIIAMTANALPEDKIKAREAGMQEHIGKPFDIQILQKCLVQWLDDDNKI